MKDLAKYSMQHLKHRKMRSLLTTLSILIGITAVFALVSFGLGIGSYVDRIAEEAGANKLFLQSKGIGAPGADKNFRLTKEDVEFVGKVNGVKEISGVYMQASEIKNVKEKKINFLVGIDTSKEDFIMETFTLEMYKGRNLKEDDLNKVVLGYNYQLDNEIFKRALKTGDKVEIDGNLVEVIGFYDKLGNPSDDASIYINYRGFESFYHSDKDKFAHVMLQAEEGVDVDELAERIKDKLRKHKGQEKGKEDFYVQTFEDILETFGSILAVINGVLVLIALISIAVASVNIMNTMYTAVLERTKEIGVMKAIGARKKDILFIFIFESGFLGMIGGIMGVILGYVAASIGGSVAASAGFSALKPIFPVYLIVGCIVFSFLVGAVAGLLPAIQASKLKPVDALRYE